MMSALTELQGGVEHPSQALVEVATATCLLATAIR